MAVALPKYVAIGSTCNRFLQFMRYVTEVLPGYLQFSETEILKTPYTKFELQKPSSTSSPNPLVHIRCCYNNMYLVRSYDTSSFILAAANEREEDQSKWNCTLFEFVPKGTVYNIVHVNSKLHLNLSNAFFLQITPTGSTSYELVDMETLLTLPKYISFKGNNGRYLQAASGNIFNVFSSDDIADKPSHYQVFPLYDGRVRIKSLLCDKFWEALPLGICNASTETASDNLFSVFFPVKVDGKVIALRNLGNNLFCGRGEDDTSFIPDMLKDCGTEINKYARLEVTDAVLRREIYDVTFQTRDARMYNLSNVDSVTKDVTNRGTESSEGVVGFSYTQLRSNTWTKSNSWSVGVSVHMTTGIPLIEEAGISIEGSYSGEYSWGETQEESKELDVNQTVITPPKTRSVVTMLVQRGTADIPFTYTQRDTLYDGTIELAEEVDGLFTGVNTYVTFDIAEEPLL